MRLVGSSRVADSVQLCQVSFSYRRRLVLDCLDIELSTGVTGLVGENGAGKTTLLRLLAGLQRPDRGSIRWQGGDLNRVPHFAREVGYLPQSSTPTRMLTTRNYVEYFALLKGLPRREVAAATDDALDTVGLSARARERTSALSGGMFKRAAIAAAIVGRPRLLLFDEPTVGLDPVQRLGILQLIGRLSEDAVTLFSTHLVEDLHIAAQHLVVLRNGKVAYAGPTADVSSRDELRAAVLALVDTGLPKSARE